jgi:drug/metabolite transporter (DMT)-like permease
MPSIHSRLISHVAILFTVLFWGMSFVSTKIVLNAGFPPLTLACVRFAIASLVLFPIVKMKEPDTRPRGRSWFKVMLGGFLGVSAYFFFENNGIRLTSASSAALIIATIPVFTLAAESLFFRYRLHLLSACGIVLSLIGVFFLIHPVGQRDLNPGNLFGNLLMLGACISWVGYITVNKTLRASFSGVALTAYNALFGTLFLLPLSLLEHRSWTWVNGPVWIHILYLSVICSAVCYFLYLFALAILKPTVVASYINLIPVVGALGGVILLNEVIGMVQLLGALGVISGVVLVNVPRSAHLK